MSLEVPTRRKVQGYLDHKRTPPPHDRTVGPCKGPTRVLGGGQFLMSDVPLQALQGFRRCREVRTVGKAPTSGVEASLDPRHPTATLKSAFCFISRQNFMGSWSGILGVDEPSSLDSPLDETPGPVLTNPKRWCCGEGFLDQEKSCRG